MTDRVPSPGGPFPHEFSRYRVERCIGEGTQGAVYRAFDPGKRSPVALKVPSAKVRADQELLARFRHECLAVSRLRQESHLCQILEVDEHAGVPYLVMQLIEGRPLPVGKPYDQQVAA